MYICNNCGYKSVSNIGKCPQCDNWNSFLYHEESKTEIKAGKKIHKENIQKEINIQKLSDIKIDNYFRYSSGINDFDEVLGGGIISGSLILLGGEPGIGKTTLLLQILSNISKTKNVLYISAEESVQQIKLKSIHLNILDENFYLLNEDCLENIFLAIDQIKPTIVVIDSIQTIYSKNTEGFIGSISQIKMCTALILEKAKKNNITFFIIAHITKDGDIAGPKNLEHMVDTVIYFEGERTQDIRIIRCIKNRFGPTGEIAIFKMKNNGLIPINDYAFHFLSEVNYENKINKIIYPHIEGNKVIFIEVQALVNYTTFGYPKRTVNGVDLNRLNILLSVLEKYLKIKVNMFDIYVNIVGNMNIKDRNIDLPICIAIYTAIKKINLNKNIIAFGEINLHGEILKLSNIDKIVKYINKINFESNIITSNKIENQNFKSKINLINIKNIKELENKI